MRIAMIGTRGVPARYGGFETCIEEVGSRMAAAGHEVTVYSRVSGEERPPRLHRGMHVVTLPAVHRRAIETLSHTALSLGHVVAGHRPDAALVFNAANAPFLPMLRAARVPVATHVDGLEWQRAKWGPTGRAYYRRAERLAVRWSDALIADAQGIADYYTREHGASTQLLAYGAPLVERRSDGVESLGLHSRSYHLVVARFEPENHVREIVEGFVSSTSTLPLVVVGSAPYAHAYTESVRAAANDRVRFLGAVWDQDLLDQLYANAAVYWHGHSVGGTNPSLLRALGAGVAANAFDCGFNREVLRTAGEWWTTPADVAALVDKAESDAAELEVRGRVARQEAERYDWDAVALGYTDLCQRLKDRDPLVGPRHSTPFDDLLVDGQEVGVDGHSDRSA